MATQSGFQIRRSKSSQPRRARSQTILPTQLKAFPRSMKMSCRAPRSPKTSPQRSVVSVRWQSSCAQIAVMLKSNRKNLLPRPALVLDCGLRRNDKRHYPAICQRGILRLQTFLFTATLRHAYAHFGRTVLKGDRKEQYSIRIDS